LLSDEPARPVEVDWWLDGADEEGALQTGSGQARAQLLVQWLANNPSLRVCNRHYLVSAQMRTELQAAIQRFEDDAVKAGTRQPASAPVVAPPAAAPGESGSP
jgi:hypothetical protein